MKSKKWFRRIGTLILFLLVFVLLLLAFSFLWAKNNYGNIGFDEIIFHLNMPLQGTADSLLIDYFKKALMPTVSFYLLFVLLHALPTRYNFYLNVKSAKRCLRFQVFPLRFHALACTLVLFVGTGLLIFDADRTFGFFDFISNQLQQSTLIEEEYVDPAETKITFPEQKRNLICIYIESGESSAQDKANGGLFDQNYIPEMTQIAKDHISFSQSELIEGASVAPACGWTIAGLVAETSGLPLKLYRYSAAEVDNSMKKYQYFLPGATTLGDILEAQGYTNVFMAGSDFEFGGRETYFTQHGNYSVWDYYFAKEKGRIPQDYKVWWGFEDQKLYAFAKEKLLKLAKSSQPFNFSMLTVDTHHQNGYVCDLCPDTWGDNQYANVWSCASAQLGEFIEWIKQQDFYENTTIVICGDHCSMDTDFYGKQSYDKHNGETTRKVYNAIIHSAVEPVKEKNRRFTTMDMFPTVLASIGAEIEGDRLALGTNLFSAQETLSEKYGYEYLFDELNKKSRFYDRELLYP